VFVSDDCSIRRIRIITIYLESIVQGLFFVKENVSLGSFSGKKFYLYQRRLHFFSLTAPIECDAMLNKIAFRER